jgi:hypothetical protein
MYLFLYNLCQFDHENSRKYLGVLINCMSKIETFFNFYVFVLYLLKYAIYWDVLFKICVDPVYALITIKNKQAKFLPWLGIRGNTFAVGSLKEEIRSTLTHSKGKSCPHFHKRPKSPE